MKPALLCLFVLLVAYLGLTCTLTPSTNDIDLSLWQVFPNGNTGSEQGIWTVFGPNNNSVEQTVNTNLTTRFVSNFNINSGQVIRGSMMGTPGDDDWLGFSLGLQCDNAVPINCINSEVVNIVWGNGKDTVNGTRSGLCARRQSITGFTGCPATTINNPAVCGDQNGVRGLNGGLQGGLVRFADQIAFHPALTCQNLNGCCSTGTCNCCDTVCPAATKIGWTYNRAYDFIIFYTPSRLRVFVDLNEVFDYSPEAFGETLMATDARAAFGALSQAQDLFTGFQLLDTGTTGCNNDPWVYDMPFEQTCTGTLSLSVNYGDGFTEVLSPMATNVFRLSRVYAPSPTGFYTVETRLLVNGNPTSPPQEETLLAFTLDPVTTLIQGDPNGSCGFAMTCTAGSGSVSLLSVRGGNRPYNITWSGNGVSQVDSEPEECGSGTCTASISGLNAGTYSVLAEDNNGCSGTHSVTIGTSSVQINSLTSTDCGSITASINSNCGPLMFSWTDSNGNPTAVPNTQNQSDLPPGTYTLVVTDPNGCSDTDTITLGYGLTGSFQDNDRVFMYVGGVISWDGFPSGTTGEIHFRCDSVGTDEIVFSGDLSTTTRVDYQPSKILPAVDCVIEIEGANSSGCYDSIQPLFLCTHPNVGAPECFY